MTKSEFLAMIEEILETDAGSVNLDARLEDLGWDSLSDVSFIAEVDSALDMEVNANQLVKCETVADLMKLVESKVTA
jgi:acyl carrier protein